VLAPRDAAPARGWLSRRRLGTLVLLGVTTVAFYLCYRIVQPFLPSLAWALALAVVASPFHRWLARRLHRRHLAAALSVAAVALLVVGPIVLISQQLISEAARAGEVVGAAFERMRGVVETDPRLAFLPRWFGGRFDVADIAAKLSGAIGTRSGAIVSGSVWAVMQLLITMFLLFYFFRDSSSAARFVRSVLPLSDAEADKIFQFVTTTIRATVFGSLGVAALQGLMGGLMFLLLGLPAALFWGAVMAVLATVPVLGTFVIWAPAAAMLAMGGEWVKAAILAAWGGVAIALIDNLLYPVLVGNQLRLHPVLVFFSVVGGLAFYGAAGVILGPLTLAITVALFDIWRWRTDGNRTADEAADTPPPSLSLERAPAPARPAAGDTDHRAEAPPVKAGATGSSPRR
jgi:predicted PurR-regulated permease PerM